MDLGQTAQTLLLKPAEVAEHLRIARASVYRLIAAKEIPTIRVGKSIRVSADALREWVINQGK